MILARTREELSRGLEEPRGAGSRIGLVPTMGYLHQGHLSLVDLGLEHADFLAASIFVNPLQFGAGEDLHQYPRDLDRDLGLLEERGVHLVFHPSVEEMYPGGYPQVTVDPGPLGDRLCGTYRPGHFRGVLTVVARLFGLFRPQVAVFGRKDFQQAVLVQRMARDLELGVEILQGPLVREADGLAMSSRNVFLEGEQRQEALGLRSALLAAQEAFSAGERSGRALRALLETTVSNRPGLRLQYAEIVDPEDLDPLAFVRAGAVVAVAAFCGNTRLIDNHTLED